MSPIIFGASRAKLADPLAAPPEAPSGVDTPPHFVRFDGICKPPP